MTHRTFPLRSAIVASVYIRQLLELRLSFEVISLADRIDVKLAEPIEAAAFPQERWLVGGRA